MILNKKDFDRIHEFYADALKIHGTDDSRSVRWSDWENQHTRFDVLLQIGDIKKASILDVGCGLGDFYGFLQDMDIPVTYTGIDIVPEFIKAAKEKFPERNHPNARFLEQDIFEITDQYDYVFSSGAMSFKVEDNDVHYKKMIQHMFSICKNGLAFNMLDITDHINDETYAAYSSEHMSRFCKLFCDRVEVMTDYLPQDFTIFCHKK